MGSMPKIKYIISCITNYLLIIYSLYNMCITFLLLFVSSNFNLPLIEGAHPDSYLYAKYKKKRKIEHHTEYLEKCHLAGCRGITM